MNQQINYLKTHQDQTMAQLRNSYPKPREKIQHFDGTANFHEKKKYRAIFYILKPTDTRKHSQNLGHNQKLIRDIV